MDWAVGFGHEGFEFFADGGAGGEGALFGGAVGAWVRGCGDGFWDGFGHCEV